MAYLLGGLEVTTMKPLPERTERRYADADVATEGGAAQARRGGLGGRARGGAAEPRVVPERDQPDRAGAHGAGRGLADPRPGRVGSRLPLPRRVPSPSAAGRPG